MQLGNFWYYLLWAGAFVVMMRFGCGAHIMGHSGHNKDLGLQPPEKDTDPVCGMTIQTAAAKSSAYQGRVYYFCSQNCREKVETAPASYVNATKVSEKKEQHHGCC